MAEHIVHAALNVYLRNKFFARPDDGRPSASYTVRSYPTTTAVYDETTIVRFTARYYASDRAPVVARVYFYGSSSSSFDIALGTARYPIIRNPSSPSRCRHVDERTVPRDTPLSHPSRVRATIYTYFCRRCFHTVAPVVVFDKGRASYTSGRTEK